ncbi:adenosylcobinamide-GDP ribazoletransferase [Dendrosporobacter sp. 1207_IL3150]|uniref:adenosylcobinamide-GDP ribazoletransferase n=1 Tax=Dendrosporobacter sp. 1207_IL3150 TaxID=3084054 RepID=UPI002FD924AB
MVKKLCGDFITGFQFLTRIYVSKHADWSPEAFGRSVKFFPLVGGIIGILLAGLAYGVQQYKFEVFPMHLLAASLIIIEIVITGGLHCDGFMDTIDGVFSGRSRERMLEIMKDSRIGAFGAIGFSLLILLKYSLILDIPIGKLPAALFVMPVIGRMASVVAITKFPYARANGLGKTFFQYSDKTTIYIAGIFTLALLIPLGNTALIAGIVAISWAALVARYISNKLGGMTGDVYGAIIEVTEVAVLMAFVF